MGARTQAFMKPETAAGALAPQASNDKVPATVAEHRVAVPIKEVPLYPPKIAKALLAITRKIQPIAKRGENTFHKYTYAKWEDILGALAPLIADNGLIITQDEISHGSFENVTMIEMTYAFTIINEEGEFWPDRPRITAICKVVDSKGQRDDKAASKCYTTAQKYLYTSLFKIRTADMEDDDHDADTGEVKQQQRRAVPSPDGTVKPHAIQIVNKEHPSQWVERFMKLFNAAKTIEEVDAWDTANEPIIDKIANGFPDVYKTLSEAMAAKMTTLKGGADKDVQQVVDPEVWLVELDGAFSGCEDLTSLAEEQERLMTPYNGKVGEAWAKALALVQAHVKRIQEG